MAAVEALPWKRNKGPLKMFSSISVCTLPSTVLHLSADQIVLKNIRYLVPDDSTTCEDFLIGFTVCRHFHANTRTFLENYIGSLQRTHYKLIVGDRMRAGKLGRRMTARLFGLENGVSTVASAAIVILHKVNFHTALMEADVFPEQSPLDSVDHYFHNYIQPAVNGMKQVVKSCGLGNDAVLALAHALRTYIVFSYIIFVWSRSLITIAEKRDYVWCQACQDAIAKKL